MSTKTQSIRPSQFILTYGPGAIIEGRNGSRIIPMPDVSLFNSQNLRPEDYEISDSRMSKGILGGARVYRLPSNAELQKPEDTPLYRTKSFPNWNLCVNTLSHTTNGAEPNSVLFHSSLERCPVCHDGTNKHKEAIRFILACPNGHLDDFSWDFFLHEGNQRCDNHDWFYWVGGGSSLSNIHLSCPQCGKKSRTLDLAYNGEWNCWGRHPHLEGYRGSRTHNERCEAKARMIQRQASNLRLPNIVALFTIPPRDTALHRMLQDRVLKSHINIKLLEGGFLGIAEFENMLKTLERTGDLRSEKVSAILNCGWEEIRTAIADLGGEEPYNYRDLILDEFTALINASHNGAPPHSSTERKSATFFEVERERVRRLSTLNGREILITPVKKLSEVVVQKSFHREIRRRDEPNLSPKPVDIAFRSDGPDGDLWYPGMELHGEGIFVSTYDGTFELNQNNSYSEWTKAFQNSNDYDPYIFRDSEHRDELHPLFVYLHTLSHALIRTISIESGYSSASIRERIYIDLRSEVPKGGFLIYATEPGSDGTSGGLVAQVERFEEILSSALVSLSSCSNDPLCGDEHFYLSSRRVSGSSCYGCVLIAETSCEHRNMWLDRNLIKEEPL